MYFDDARMISCGKVQVINLYPHPNPFFPFILIQQLFDIIQVDSTLIIHTSYNPSPMMNRSNISTYRWLSLFKVIVR